MDLYPYEEDYYATALDRDVSINGTMVEFKGGSLMIYPIPEERIIISGNDTPELIIL